MGNLNSYRRSYLPGLLVPETGGEEKVGARSVDGDSSSAQVEKRLEVVANLAGGIAHDFNNILSIIDGYARLGLSRLNDGDSDAVETYLDRIHQASMRGSGLTRKLLTFGRHKVVGNEPLDLRMFVEQQKLLMMPVIGVDINLYTNCQSNIAIECPSDLLAEALMNLVSNARDAMPDGGTLMIESMLCDPVMLPRSLTEYLKTQGGEPQEYVLLSVSDTGCGMTPQQLDRAFDPFYTTKEQGKGTGLGLSVVYGVAKQMDACIEVESLPTGGTTVFLYIPVSKKKAKVQLDSGDYPPEGNLSFEGYTVLVVDDEKELLESVTEELGNMGFDVLSASNGNKALEVQDEYIGAIDLLLTDVVMPEITGKHLAELMADVRPATKVIFMSGYPANGSLEGIEFPDGANLIAKPLQYDSLARSIYNVLQVKGDDAGRMVEGNVWKFE